MHEISRIKLEKVNLRKVLILDLGKLHYKVTQRPPTIPSPLDLSTQKQTAPPDPYKVQKRLISHIHTHTFHAGNMCAELEVLL